MRARKGKEWKQYQTGEDTYTFRFLSDLVLLDCVLVWIVSATQACDRDEILVLSMSMLAIGETKEKVEEGDKRARDAKKKANPFIQAQRTYGRMVRGAFARPMGVLCLEIHPRIT